VRDSRRAVKVDILGPVYPYRGGIAHYTTRLYRELHETGVDVRVLNLRRQYPRALFPGSTQTDSSEEPFRVENVRLLDSMNPLSWRETVRAIRARETTHLIVQWWHPFFAPSFGAVAWGARRLGVHVSFICHNVLPHEPSPVDRTLARAAYRHADRFVVHAQQEAARLESLVGANVEITVSPHPVYDAFAPPPDLDRASARVKLGLEMDTPVVLFFGLIRRYKGLDILFDALARTRPEVEAIVVGECYEDVEIYRAQLRALGLEARVRFEPRYAANEEVPALFAAADVVALPYRNATQSGIVQIAYASQRPVITTRVGGLPDVVFEGETGLLVPPSDAMALASAIDRFFDDPALRSALDAGASTAAARFEWSTLVRAVLPELGRHTS